MASNKERDEVHKAIWSTADDLRGAVDGWDFKQYILGIMFYRYISENIANYINELQRNAGDKSFEYAKDMIKQSFEKIKYDLSRKLI